MSRVPDFHSSIRLGARCALAFGLTVLAGSLRANEPHATEAEPAANHAEAETAGTDDHAAPETIAVASEENATPDQVARSLLVLAKRYAERRDLDGAETAYHQLLDSGASPEVIQQGLLTYADFLRQNGREIRAVATYEKFIDAYPQSPLVPSVMLSLGRALRQMGAFDQALSRFYAVLNTTISTSPGQAEDYRGLAQLAKFEIADTFYQRGDYASAGKYFGRIRLLELPEGDRARAMFREAYALYLNNELEKSVPALRSFISRYPDDPSRQEAQHLLCLALRGLNRMSDALAETLTLLRAAQVSSGEDQERWAYWQRKTGNQLANDFFVQGDFTAALTIYQTLAQLRPEPGWRWPAVYQVGLCYERLQQAERATAAYRSILSDAETAKKAGTALAKSEHEVAEMAEWRVGQIDWSHRVDTTRRQFQMPEIARRPSDTQDLAATH